MITRSNFETLLSKTKGVFRDQLASYFINGLKENIRYSAQLKEPHTVNQAVSYAKKSGELNLERKTISKGKGLLQPTEGISRTTSKPATRKGLI